MLREFLRASDGRMFCREEKQTAAGGLQILQAGLVTVRTCLNCVTVTRIPFFLYL